MKWIFVAIFLWFTGVRSCTLDTSLHGTWTTTNFRTVTIQDANPQLSMTQLFLGVTGSSTDFNCLLISGDKFILQSNNTISVFSGTTEIFIYMCISFTETSANTFYYYLNSNVETGLDNYRLVGLPTTTTVTMASQVCTATPDIAEYHMMVRDGVTGYEQGTVQLPTPLLGLFLYTYTRDGTPFCDTVNATINSCDNQTLTSVFANDSNCNTANTFYSADGVLGCVASLFSASRSTYYVTLYNGDTSVDSVNTFRFSCLAVSSETNGTVYVTVNPTTCDGGQNSTTAPSPGALMILQPVFTCVPTSDNSDYTLLIVLLCVFGALIIVIIIIFVCCYLRYRKKRKVKAREKKMLISEDHPLGEVSIALDTPATMEPVVLENGHETFRSPRRKKSLANNPLSESSMNLDFIGRQWTTTSRSGSRMVMDPLTEMETGAIVPLGSQGPKSIRSLKSRQSSFVGRPYMNGDVKQPLALTDSKPKELNAKSLMNGDAGNKPGSKDLVRSSTMIKAPSIRSARSVKASSIVTESLKSNGAVVRVTSMKGKNKPATRPSKPIRSATSTRIGSVTKNSSKRMTRADTVIVPTKTEDGPGEDKTGQVQDFLSGEMTTVGSISARSEGGRTKKSGKSTKSKSSMARSTGPSRSLKVSESRRQMSLMEMNEPAIYLPDPGGDRSFISHDLMRESFRTARELKELRLRAKKPTASKSPWK